MIGSNAIIFTALAIFVSITSEESFDVSQAFHLSRILLVILVKLGTKNIIKLFFFSVPWNQSTLSGYIGEENFICYCGGTYMVSDGVILLLFISICTHHQAFYDVFANTIDQWNRRDANQNDEQFIFDLMRFDILIKE